MQPVLHLLLSPFGLLLAVNLALGGLLWRSARPRWQRLAACAGLLLVWLPAVPWFANWALGRLEQQAQALPSCAPPAPGSLVIVLAGGVHGEPARADDYEQLSHSSMRRVLGATRLALRTPRATLLLSGGAGGTWREADLMAALARQLGMPASRIVEDRDAMTTLGSAVDLQRMLRGDARPRYLVTSAWHMPRAWHALRSRGVATCAWPVDFRAYALSPDEMLLPQLSALSKSELALHEWLGSLVYAWRGASDAR